MSNLLKKAIWFEENKDKFTTEERNTIRKGLLTQCSEKIKILTSVFIESIDKVND
ncbi:hypothetical protein [Changchengzhania lutea]|uniref:hypothetical protein n=1 Tax=Changchengzhania lutea TaxID=2049305 RepID=UPI00163D6B9C|nr:hypothetical protein [Changchengzhania lutea]